MRLVVMLVEGHLLFIPVEVSWKILLLRLRGLLLRKGSGEDGMWNKDKQDCVVIDEANLLSLCGAHIGPAKGRFCTAPKLEGQQHCGFPFHATSTHQVLQVGYIFVPAAVNRGNQVLY